MSVPMRALHASVLSTLVLLLLFAITTSAARPPATVPPSSLVPLAKRSALHPTGPLCSPCVSCLADADPHPSPTGPDERPSSFDPDSTAAHPSRPDRGTHPPRIVDRHQDLDGPVRFPRDRTGDGDRGFPSWIRVVQVESGRRSDDRPALVDREGVVPLEGDDSALADEAGVRGEETRVDDQDETDARRMRKLGEVVGRQVVMAEAKRSEAEGRVNEQMRREMVPRENEVDGTKSTFHVDAAPLGESGGRGLVRRGLLKAWQQSTQDLVRLVRKTASTKRPEGDDTAALLRAESHLNEPSGRTSSGSSSISDEPKEGNSAVEKWLSLAPGETYDMRGKRFQSYVEAKSKFITEIKKTTGVREVDPERVRRWEEEYVAMYPRGDEDPIVATRPRLGQEPGREEYHESRLATSVAFPEWQVNSDHAGGAPWSGSYAKGLQRRAVADAVNQGAPSSSNNGDEARPSHASRRRLVKRAPLFKPIVSKAAKFCFGCTRSEAESLSSAPAMLPPWLSAEEHEQRLQEWIALWPGETISQNNARLDPLWQLERAIPSHSADSRELRQVQAYYINAWEARHGPSPRGLPRVRPDQVRADPSFEFPGRNERSPSAEQEVRNLSYPPSVSEGEMEG